jgi:hypothetical protein
VITPSASCNTLARFCRERDARLTPDNAAAPALDQRARVPQAPGAVRNDAATHFDAKPAQKADPRCNVRGVAFAQSLPVSCIGRPHNSDKTATSPTRGGSAVWHTVRRLSRYSLHTVAPFSACAPWPGGSCSCARGIQNRVRNRALNGCLVAWATAHWLSKLRREWCGVATGDASAPRTWPTADRGRTTQRQPNTTCIVPTEGAVLDSAPQDQ